MERLANPPEWELYDLENDPIEFHNRSGDAQFGKVESRLKSALATWQKETGDRFGDPAFRLQVQEEHHPNNR